VIYTPDGASPREWSVDFDNPAWDLLYATEKATDWPWNEFTARLQNGSGIALRALIWTLRKRDQTKLDLAGVQVTWGEVELVQDEEPDTDPADDGDEPEAPKA
jgi:hypothetical protein